MFDIIPFWMWALSLLVLAIVCGAALSQQEANESRRDDLRARPVPVRKGRWHVRW